MYGLLRIFNYGGGSTGLLHQQLAIEFICQLSAKELVMRLKSRNEKEPIRL
jgi:hypothetical protein